MVKGDWIKEGAVVVDVGINSVDVSAVNVWGSCIVKIVLLLVLFFTFYFLF